MDTDRFDALTRLVATRPSRRQMLRALGGGALAALGVGRAGRTEAAQCPGGVACAGRCCEAGEICLAGGCASCASGVICAAQCCAAGESCIGGRCIDCASGVICADRCCDEGETCVNARCVAALTSTPAPNPGPCQPATACPEGQVCGTYDDGCGGTISCGQCLSPYVCNTYDNPPPNCVCEDFQTVCNGKCGPMTDACGEQIYCGDCDTGCCHADNICAPPACAGKTCGDDGCGGSCGTCGPGETCESGNCVCTNTAGICHTPSGDVCSANNACYGSNGWCPSGYIDSSGVCCCLNVAHPFDGNQCHMYPDSGCCLAAGASCDDTTATDCCSGECVDFTCQ